MLSELCAALIQAAAQFVEGIGVERLSRNFLDDLTLLTVCPQFRGGANNKIGTANGPKDTEGDNKTPEGIYTIDSRNNKSRYHLSLHISYPNPKDIQHARTLGVSPGGNIMIHGIMNGLGWIGRLHRWFDWTKGCIGVTNPEIDEIARLVPNGTMVEIRP